MLEGSRLLFLSTGLFVFLAALFAVPDTDAAESRLQVITKDTVRLSRSDPAVQRFRLPGQPGAPVSALADHDGQTCAGGGSRDEKFGNGAETECRSETRNGTNGTMCCPVTCTYRCESIGADGKGTFKGTCQSDTAGQCTWTPNQSGGGGGILQDQGSN